MSWLGQGFSRESMKSMLEAYQQVNETVESPEKVGKKQQARKVDLNKRAKDKEYDKFGGKPPWMKEEAEEIEEIIDEYSVSVEDGIQLEEGKKKCKDGYKYDSKKKKCVKKKKSSSSSSKKSSKTTIIVGRGYGYGGGHHHHDDDKETESNGGGNGGDAGGDVGGDGGGGGGE